MPGLIEATNFLIDLKLALSRKHRSCDDQKALFQSNSPIASDPLKYGNNSSHVLTFHQADHFPCRREPVVLTTQKRMEFSLVHEIHYTDNLINVTVFNRDTPLFRSFLISHSNKDRWHIASRVHDEKSSDLPCRRDGNLYKHMKKTRQG